MNENLQEVCDLLDELSATVLNASSENRIFPEIQNWNWPAVNRHILASIPKNISQRIKENFSDKKDDSLNEILVYVLESLTYLKQQIVPLMFNGNGLQAIPSYISTLESLKSVFEPMTGWQTLIDNKAMPNQLIRRLRSIQIELDEITPKKEELESQIKLIQEATQTAESLPADLDSLKEARKKVEKFTTDSAELFGKIDTYNSQASIAIKSLNDRNTEAGKIVLQCEEAYRVTTSTGLAAAFDERAKKSSDAVITWVICLIVALSIGAFIGSNRVNLLSNLIKEQNLQWGVIWMHIVLSIISIGAPLWFAWLSTKQINQRFRLSEDYAFKASVAKAYEGYRREAARIDPLFEARLFSSALTRLEEAPLRFVSDDIHGSPWHELFASKPFQDALKTVPDFKDTIIQTLKDKLPNLNRKTVADIDSTINDSTEKEP